MKRYEVLLSPDAQQDVQDIYDYIAHNDSELKADAVIEKLKAVLVSLEGFPQRGAVTKELRDIGITDYREVYFKPHRIVYRTLQDQVMIYLVVDGRRNMQTVLTRRLMRA
jgi:toxin ParE1/3/4